MNETIIFMKMANLAKKTRLKKFQAGINLSDIFGEK
jgi:hypothetical protein